MNPSSLALPQIVEKVGASELVIRGRGRVQSVSRDELARLRALLEPRLGRTLDEEALAHVAAAVVAVLFE